MKTVVSIITPVFNGKKYIEDCLRSVLNQSYLYIEHVVVDGASKDGTVEILENYAAKYPDKIKFLSEPDKNLGEAWNKGLRMAKGDIIGWLGFDDMLYGTESIKSVVEFFQSHPDACFVHGGCNYIDEGGKITSTHMPREHNMDELINDNNYIACPAAFYRREVVNKVGWFDEIGSDLDYMIRIAKLFPIHRVGQILANFRVRADSLSGCAKNYVREARWDYIVIRKHGGRILSKRARRYFKF